MQENGKPENDAVVRIADLSRTYRRKQALDNVSLTVPRGSVYGLVGENGAGKTTLVKHIMGGLRAQSGSVRVFGLDPVAEPVAVLGRIGYLSEDRDLPGWMRVGELMRYTQAFYPNWDPDYAEALRAQFKLPAEASIRKLSRGERAKAGLLVALAHRPDLLLLDEPSSGLDPVARRDILAAVVRTVADEGRTVIFSSHLLEEVERVADLVAMICNGRAMIEAPLDDLKERHAEGVVMTDGGDAPPELPGLLACEGAGREWRVLCEGAPETLRAAAARRGLTLIEARTPTLERIFIARLQHASPAEKQP